MILYLHGFRSSPLSAKAQILAEAVRRHGLGGQWHCPQLPASPAKALDLAHGVVARHLPAERIARETTLIGSSLGGYYAASLAARLGCRAVLLNPVIHAARDLATQVGEHTQFHSPEPFVFLPGHVDELAAMAPPRPARPERHFLLACTGDEVLDWREMAHWYSGAASRIVNGSDHGIADFRRWLPEVMAFILNGQGRASPGAHHRSKP